MSPPARVFSACIHFEVPKTRVPLSLRLFGAETSGAPASRAKKKISSQAARTNRKLAFSFGDSIKLHSRFSQSRA